MSEGRLGYPRHDELEGVISDAVHEKWKREDYRLKSSELKPVSQEEGKAILKKQAFRQIEASFQMKGVEGLPDPPEHLRGLPERIESWLKRHSSATAAGDELMKEASELLAFFEANYTHIRYFYGERFGAIKAALKNFVRGAAGRVKAPGGDEYALISGDMEKMARSGSEPVFTCHTLEFAWSNEDGEPLNIMIHGQFKVANWEIDGTVVARRLLEITIDEWGVEHLLVDQIFSAGGFVRAQEMRGAILEYTNFLGLKGSNVHFSDEASFATAPRPLATGDKVNRDSFGPEGFTFSQARDIQKRRASAGK